MKKINIRSPFAVLLGAMLLVALNISMFKVIRTTSVSSVKSVMGGTLLAEGHLEQAAFSPGDAGKEEDYIERFLRPSNEKTLDKKYFFGKKGEELPKVYQASGEVVRAYFDIISDAANMGSKKGGCGSIGFGTEPYPAAYNLFTEGVKKGMPFESFVKSFEGIGHVNLLKLVESPAVKMGDSIYPRFFVEIETIEGTDMQGKTSFAYYYGYVTAASDSNNGWRINSIELIPEDFLCHAYHGWQHDGISIVKIIYGERLGLIDKILNTETDGYFSNIIAKGKDGKQYRFMFIRITDGADIPFRQFVMENGKWKDIYIDPEAK